MILHGDCREQLATLPDASIDSIVTDPPYELGFMGKHWDASGIAYDPTVWTECLRVLKPGGHLCAFGGTRTYHRMTVAIEDAGFEIRDSLHWLYGSGFPKSLDVSKAIDKRGGTVAGFESFRDAVRDAMVANGVSRKTLTDALGNHMLSHYLTAGSQPAVPNLRDYRIIRDTVGLSDKFDSLFVAEADREIVGTKASSLLAFAPGEGRDQRRIELTVTTAATDAAREWDGWGTALKPAHEPIVLARKPLIGTVAANVLAHGTGALNIDACRVANTGAPIQRKTGTRTLGGVSEGYDRPWKHDPEAVAARQERADAAIYKANTVGRWPANIILTHSPECEQTGTAPDTFTVVAGFRDYAQDSNFGARAQVTQKPQTVEVATWDCVAGCPVAALNEQSGTTRDGVAVNRNGHNPDRQGYGKGWGTGPRPDQGYNGSGGASRFFTNTTWDPEHDAPFLYVAKPGKKERNAGLDGMAQQSNFHPTVKPVALMRHLVRLVTPPGGTVLDPFLGSGTTAVAAILEGFDWIGCELTDDYLPIIEARVAWANGQSPTSSAAPVEPSLTLFGDTE